MDLGGLLFISLILFFIIFGAVRLAISPMIDKENDLDNKTALSFMREIEILSPKEYKNIISTYQNDREIKNKQIQFEKHKKVLFELKEKGFITETECEIKVNKLKNHFKID